MFRCELTGKNTKSGEKMKKIVLETRERVYYDKDDYEIGRGREIVKEISVCESAYREYLKEHPELAETFRSKKAQRVTSSYSAPLEISIVEETVPVAQEPSALEKHMQLVREGKLVPVERDGQIVYVSPEQVA